MKKALSIILIITVFMSIMIVPSFAETMCPICGNHTVNFYVYTRYKANNSRNKLYAQNVNGNNVYTYCVSGGNFYGYGAYSSSLYDVHVYTTEEEMNAKYDEDVKQEERLTNPSIADAINKFVGEVWENEVSNWNNIYSTVEKEALRIWEDVNETFYAGLDYIGNKVDNAVSLINLGEELLDEYGAYIIGKVRSAYSFESEEYRDNYQVEINIDASNNVYNYYPSGYTSNDYSYRYDFYVNRNADVNNVPSYNIRIYNFDTNALVYEDDISPVLNETDNNYYLATDNWNQSSHLPTYRGIYKTEMYPVLWDNHNDFKPNNTYIPKSSGGTRGISGNETPVSESEYMLVNDDELDDLSTIEPKDNTEIIWLQKIYNKLQDIFDYLINGDEDANQDPSKPKNVLGWLDHLTGLVTNIKDFFTTDLPNLGSAFSGLGNSVGNAVSRAFDKFEIPTGFALGLPKLIILIGGVLIALTGVVSRFIVFISTLWNVEPTSELLNQGMIDGLNYVRSITIPIFGNLITLTFSMVSIFTAFMLIKLIRRNEING